jgi:hypothetical protein
MSRRVGVTDTAQIERRVVSVARVARRGALRAQIQSVESVPRRSMALILLLVMLLMMLLLAKPMHLPILLLLEWPGRVPAKVRWRWRTHHRGVHGGMRHVVMRLTIAIVAVAAVLTVVASIEIVDSPSISA